MRELDAPAKINLALVVGPLRADGKHEVTTVLQRIGLADGIALEPAQTPALDVQGFAPDTLVRGALELLALAAGAEPSWTVRITKRIPVAAGLGGGSTDAAAALRLANEILERPLPPDALARLAAKVGADVPFFLAAGPQLGEGDGSALTAVELPREYAVLLVVPDDAVKSSTREVYAAFDARDGADGYESRRTGLLEALAEVRAPRDLSALPTNDLASSPLVEELRALGAFRADVSGAGPAVYGLFDDTRAALTAKDGLHGRGRSWIVAPAW